MELEQALNIAAAAAQSAATAQVAAERAVEEVRRHVAELKSWEKSPRKTHHEIIREVMAENPGALVVDLSPLQDRISQLEQRASEPISLPAVINHDDGRLAAMEAAIADLKTRPTKLIPVSTVDETRMAKLEAQVSEVVQQMRSLPKNMPDGVVDTMAASMLDRMSALEELVVESVQAPHALARQLQITAEIMEAMDTRINTMRDADKAILELHRQASEQTAMAQGGLTAVVQSLQADMSTISATVAGLQNRIARKDDYTAHIVRRGRG